MTPMVMAAYIASNGQLNILLCSKLPRLHFIENLRHHALVADIFVIISVVLFVYIEIIREWDF